MIMKETTATTLPPHRTHPRRPPAHKSVSLRHGPPSGLSSKTNTLHQRQSTSLSSPHHPASDKANPPSSASPNFQLNKHSSGESSDAGNWFESSNNNALQSNASFGDNNDPPFFLRNSSSSDTPPDGRGSRDQGYQRKSTMVHRPGLTNVQTDASSTDDFRSVIDDLTVVNKKLKQKLKKYEKLYDAHLQDEKLFEVRFHGLPDHKKKELEETLRKFAANLGDSPPIEYPTVSHHPPAFDARNTASSHTSRFAESGYASMSASGHNSSSGPSNQASIHASIQDKDRRRMTKSQYTRQQQSIHSYLHDIPVGLLPRNHAPMTEKSKKKLVVRRLEQIFAGKRSAPGNHPQPMQQEEVAQSAAMADRRAREATGQLSKTEGHREARIMPVKADDEEISAQAAGNSLQKSRPHLSTNEQDLAGSGSPDQRPTRPLDLDPYRAQVPNENMDYIRHLGFTPPNMDTGESHLLGHGWLYLNLLINMAQLHTLNVTPEFVQAAVTEHSTKFELSHDGRKIRWKGGHSVSKLSSDGSSDQLNVDSPSENKSPNKRIMAEQCGGGGSNVGSDRHVQRKTKEQNKLAYTPIFFHKESSEDEDDFYGFDIRSSSNSLYQPQQPGDSSGFSSSAMRSSSSRKQRNDGPMIFYNKAKFCTDLSGDRHVLGGHQPDTYDSISQQPLGVTSTPGPAMHHSDFEAGELRGPLDDSPVAIEAKPSTQLSSSEDETGFSLEALKDDNGTRSPDTIEFEASGLGGVQPDDNFAIQVSRSQIRTAQSKRAYTRRGSQLYSEKISKALNKNTPSGASSPRQLPIIKEEILSTLRKPLPKSILPPASFLPIDSTSSGDVDSDLESNVSSDPSTTDSDDYVPTTLQLLNLSPTHPTPNNEDSEEQSSSEDDDDCDSNESIDLLATARKMDPETIRDCEREYDAAVAERLAEQIPAGSSAATAGGGSGFTSPADKIAGVAMVSKGEQSSQRPRARKQSTTSGSTSSRAKKPKRTRTQDPPAPLPDAKRQKSEKLE